MATKSTSYNAVLAYSTDDLSYTTISDVRMARVANMSKGDVNSTVLDSADHTKDFLPGWRDGGEVNITVALHKTQYSTLLGFFNSEAIYYWRITFNLITGESTTGSRLKAQGYVKAMDLSEVKHSDDAIIEVPITIKATTKWTFTAGS